VFYHHHAAKHIVFTELCRLVNSVFPVFKHFAKKTTQRNETFFVGFFLANEIHETYIYILLYNITHIDCEVQEDGQAIRSSQVLHK
jgi:hypothetical protein